MTPEEQVRMNELCAAIQQERNYERFAAMLHEMSELIARKEQRRFPDQPKIVWARNKPWTSMSATASRLLRSVDGPNRTIEIAIPAAGDLFREIRIDNQFTSVGGKTIALAAGTQLTLTLEAEVSGTASSSN
jgi:hypothetical protein